MKKAPICVICVLIWGLMAHFGPAQARLTGTSAGYPCAESHGQVLDRHLNSVNTRSVFNYRVYLPPCYAVMQKSYPYVILLPGIDSDQTEWTAALDVNGVEDAGVTSYALPPMILVMPDGGFLMKLNAFPPKRTYEALIVDELVPEIERNFCTERASADRAIGGISRGGFWALEIAFRHPNLFGAVGGHSAVFDDTVPPETDPLHLAAFARFAPWRAPQIWLDIGQYDDNLSASELLQGLLTQRGLDSTLWVVAGGQHNVAYWRAHVGAYLAFYGLHWSQNSDDLPPCQIF